MNDRLALGVTIPVAVDSLRPWVEAGVFDAAEVQGAEVLTRRAVAPQLPLVLAAALALWAPRHGHTCIDLGLAPRLVGNELAAARMVPGPNADRSPSVQRSMTELPWPPAELWIGMLRDSDLVRCVDGIDPDPILDDCPLVLIGPKLYTQRQWIDECSVAASLLQRTGSNQGEPISANAESLLQQLLPPSDTDEPNLQHEAARAMLSGRLTVVVGGPGTGKTHTISRALAVLLTDAAASGRAVRIGLAAPTGKAAARMHEALSHAAEGTARAASSSDCALQLAALRPTTIHRMLGRRGSTTRFVHDRRTPLPYDVVVIDEASMVALPLMARLLEAVPPQARLVLVGDPDQLHSIEVGSILTDVVAAARESTSELHHHVIRLQRPRRQVAGSPISVLADAVRNGDPDAALALLRDGTRTGGAHTAGAGESLVSFVETADPLAAAIDPAVRDAIVPSLAAALEAARAGNAGDALRCLGTVRVLCAHREGRHGAQMWNRLIETWVRSDFADENKQGSTRGATSAAGGSRYFVGQALLATQNDLRQRVANGDTGIVIANRAGVRAAFGTAGGIRILAPAQLERVEAAYATTVHKSQGSEYHTAVVVLPPDGSPLAGRELLYTALTRATTRLVAIGTAASLRACINTPTRRVTGLAEALLNGLAAHPRHKPREIS